MKKTVKLFLLMLCFSVEIRIHAEGPFVESSFGIQNQSAKIASKNLNQNLKVVFGPSAALKNSDGQVHWISGQGVVDSKSYVRLTSSYGRVECHEECVLAIEKKEGRISLHSFLGTWSVDGVQAGNKVQIRPGSSIDLLGVGDKESSQLEFPYTISDSDLNQYLQNYLKLADNSSRSKKIKELWSAQVEEISELYQNRADRSIASVREGEVRRARAAAAERAETLRLREEFRRRNDLDQ